jgi:hypothetical protein
MRLQVPFGRKPQRIIQRTSDLEFQEFLSFTHPTIIRNDIDLKPNLPIELVQNIIIQTVIDLFKARRIKQVVKLISSNQFYIKYFYRYFFGSTNIEFIIQHARLTRTLFLIDTIYDEILLHPLDYDEYPEYFMIDLLIHEDLKTYYPWNFVEQPEGVNFVDMNLLITGKPEIENYKDSFEIFRTGNLFGDIIYCTGVWDFQPIFNFKVKDFRTPIIAFMLCQNNTNLFTTQEFVDQYKWLGFIKICKHMFGKHTGVYFTKEETDIVEDEDQLELFEG